MLNLALVLPLSLSIAIKKLSSAAIKASPLSNISGLVAMLLSSNNLIAGVAPITTSPLTSNVLFGESVPIPTLSLTSKTKVLFPAPASIVKGVSALVTSYIIKLVPPYTLQSVTPNSSKTEGLLPLSTFIPSPTICQFLSVVIVPIPTLPDILTGAKPDADPVE